MAQGAPPPAKVPPPPEAVALEVLADEAAAGPDSSAALSAWNEAMTAYLAAGAWMEAARVASKLASCEESGGLTDLAALHFRQAADCYRAAGEVHRVPMCLNNLAMLRKLSGDMDAASVLLVEALKTALSCHGHDHQETALIAANLGSVMCERGDFLAAEQHHMQALRIREHMFGPTHPEVGLSLGHLAVIHQIRGDLKRARSFYHSALAILDEFPGLHEGERMILRANLQEL